MDTLAKIRTLAQETQALVDQLRETDASLPTAAEAADEMRDISYQNEDLAQMQAKALGYVISTLRRLGYADMAEIFDDIMDA